ncbi:MAG: hypothetical protein V2J20_08065 [Wenzhouxiangella sp.]|nr:hypothetical protein [Wenzhouxiangella sp.]
MGIFKHLIRSTAAACLCLGFSSDAFSNGDECSGPEQQVGEPELISATIQEISVLTGIDTADLEWATATKPLFTVVIDGKAIPYHEFGPESDEPLVTRSGLHVRPKTNSIEIDVPSGFTVNHDLSSTLAAKSKVFETKASSEDGGQPEYWFIWPGITAIGGMTCTALTEICQRRCGDRVAECGPCGGWCDCDWCGRGSHGCFTCPIRPDTSFFTP